MRESPPWGVQNAVLQALSSSHAPNSSSQVESGLRGRQPAGVRVSVCACAFLNL